MTLQENNIHAEKLLETLKEVKHFHFPQIQTPNDRCVCLQKEEQIEEADTMLDYVEKERQDLERELDQERQAAENMKHELLLAKQAQRERLEEEQARELAYLEKEKEWYFAGELLVSVQEATSPTLHSLPCD